MSSTLAAPICFVGFDVHKGSVTAAVFRNRDAEPLRVVRLPDDLERIRRYFERMAAEGEPRVCDECRRRRHLGALGHPVFRPRVD